jgi:hypothetical protein
MSETTAKVTVKKKGTEHRSQAETTAAEATAGSAAMNVDEAERTFSLLAGGLALYMLARRSWFDFLLATGAAVLLFRSVTGYCPWYGFWGINTRTSRAGQEGGSRPDNSGRRQPRDTVEQASWESFPASDPPHWSG